MERGEDAAGRHWPEEVVQMILARIPFPHLFKVQAVSKTWKGIFSNALRRSDKPLDARGRSFQSDVVSVSTRWPEYCPVFGTFKEFWAYSQASRNWLRVSVCISKAFPYPPEWFRFSRFSGPLVCLVGQVVDDIHLTVVVVNILTSRYKRLPLLTGADADPQFELLTFKKPEYIRLDLPINGEEQPHPYDVVFVSDSHGYRVLLLFEFICIDGETGEDSRGSLIYVYESKNGTWERNWTKPHRHSVRNTNNIHIGSTAYTGKDVYCLCLEPAHVWIYRLPWKLSHVNDTLWTPYYFSERLELGEVIGWGIVAFGTNVMVATLSGGKRTAREAAVAHVYELHPVTLKCREVSSTAAAHVVRHARIVADCNFIYFCPEYIRPGDRFPILVYSVTGKQWSEVALPEVGERKDYHFLLPGAFQPGSHPFLDA